MLLNLIFALTLTATAYADPANCPDGFYDLGPQAAALSFTCSESTPGAAEIVFCHRETLLNSGVCTGRLEPIPCTWQNADGRWRCEKQGAYPLVALIHRLNSDRISYQFCSSFNSGELEGVRIPNE